MKFEKAIALRVELKDAEMVRKFLIINNILRNDLKIRKNEKFIYFPLKEKPNEFNSYKILNFGFEKITKKLTSYKDLLKVPHYIKQKFRTSYDVIGEIILIKLSEDLSPYFNKIGNALLECNKNVKTVCISNPVSGELRIRDLKIIAGENNTFTTHREYNLLLKVDIRKTYFSPRLSNERKRVADLVQSGETIVDMFAGVAPFSIMIAKYSNPKIVFAIDKNKDSIILAKDNIKINKVLDKVEIVYSDVKKVSNCFENFADRIIMNLPFTSHKFFRDAIKIAKNNCVIHYYDILRDEDINSRIDYLKGIALKNNVSLTCFNVNKIKTYAPREFYIVIDITATKNADVA